ncbi:aminoglycoside phosphotransferase family protein [Lapillicoccus jejuensis]|uniref:Phosphotransferase family enzyme n=1 Tax=Lapillicoccus jejuensis TaxID=402171 RepID=A0A542E358_9MICO|nr:aminoglycoside phosphotransferase family protein [Lapillicoccus jejuensis]TQJ09763.1 phosphotransferase family enzyme [Lapillicoccus jejuensis]
MSAAPFPPREVTVVLTDRGGRLLGALGPLHVERPWWSEVEDVLGGLGATYGVRARVLRLLTSEEPYAGGPVTYLAEPVGPVPDRLDPVPPAAERAAAADPTRRQWWARPGALEDLAGWAGAALARHGRGTLGDLRQRRTWNLSLVATLEAEGGRVWLKAVPAFLADEAAVLDVVHDVAPGLGPVVLGRDPARRMALLDDVPGEDRYDETDPDLLAAMARRWVGVQAAAVDRVDDLLRAGAVDTRPAALVDDVAALLARPDVAAPLEPATLGRLHDLLDGLPARLDAVDACGLPDTLVHGDLHTGNWRVTGARADGGPDGGGLRLLDWGDVRIGHPALDLLRLAPAADPGLAAHVTQVWSAAWRAIVPGAAPDRAADLLRPVEPLVAATTYQRFLDGVEETERVFHHLDVPAALRAAAGPVSGG